MAKQIYRAVAPNNFSSSSYWEQRYAHGGSSGAGSYGRLSRFKAETINRFVEDNGVRTIIEFGSGDGAQLELARYPAYLGIDVSSSAIELCRTKFRRDPSKRFCLVSSHEANDARAELTLSLDVIYHLVEEAVYDKYMAGLVTAAERFICIYSSNVAKIAPAKHVRHRVFSEWMTRNAPAWMLIQKLDNPFPEDPENPDHTSWADFYFYEKSQK
jgi:hypothetical protein